MSDVDGTQTTETHHRVALFLNGAGVSMAGSSIGQGLRAIGYGLTAIAISGVICTATVVTYLNGGS